MKKILSYLSVSALLMFGSFSYMQASSFAENQQITMKCGSGDKNKCNSGKCGSGKCGRG